LTTDSGLQAATDAADVASILARALEPRAVAVYGATDRMPGRQYVDAVVLSPGYADRTALVNPSPKTIHGLSTTPSALDSHLAGQLDFAVIATPIPAVAASVEDCGRAGIPVASIITAGFSEAGGDGRGLQEELLATARASNVRLIGPNTMGVINVTAGFRAARPYFVARPGSISVLAQSGVIPSRIMEEVGMAGHGIDIWATLGNCADLGVPDFLPYLAARETTKVIVVYLESVTDPDALRTALQQARAAGKEVVVLKSGRTARGSVATASHTGAVSSPHTFFELLLRECDVVSARTVRQAVEAAVLLDTHGRIRGGIAVVLGSGGEAALTTDLAEEYDVPLARIQPETVAKIKALVPEIGTVNPIDLTWAAGQRGHSHTIYDLFADEPDVGCIVLLDGGLWPPGSFPPEMEAKRFALEYRLAEKVPVIREVREHDPSLGPNDRLTLVQAGIAVTREAETLWPVMRQLVRRPRSDDEHEEPAAVAEQLIPPPANQIVSELDALRVLASARIPVVPYRLLPDESEARIAFAEFGPPVVLKGIARGVTHKTEAGLVRLNIADETAALDTYRALRASLAAYPDAEVVMQPQIRDVVAEMIVGIVNDPRWGLHLMLGPGGLAAEEVTDRVWAALPLDREDARTMIQSIPVCRAIARRRAGGAALMERLADLLLALSDFASASERTLAEVEINPVLIREADVLAVDAVLSFTAAVPQPD
jgi:acyl-CoA synthetase (NDP forming)